MCHVPDHPAGIDVVTIERSANILWDNIGAAFGIIRPGINRSAGPIAAAAAAVSQVKPGWASWLPQWIDNRAMYQAAEGLLLAVGYLRRELLGDNSCPWLQVCLGRMLPGQTLVKPCLNPGRSTSVNQYLCTLGIAQGRSCFFA